MGASLATDDGVVDELAAYRGIVVSVWRELDQSNVILGEGRVLISREVWNLSRTLIVV